MKNTLIQLVENRNVLFITTKNIDYIRNTQEIEILTKHAKQLRIIYSNSKNYVVRIVVVWLKCLFTSKRKIDIVFEGFSPQLLFPIQWMFRKKYILIDFFISVYDTLVNDRRKIAPNSSLAKICHWLDTYTIHKANHVIVDTKSHGSYFENEFAENEYEVLYLRANDKIYYPREQKKADELKDKYVVLYFGSILPLQGIDIILEAAEKLEEISKLRFQIIGPVPEDIKRKEQDNVEYIQWLSQEQLSEYIANADLCLAGHFNNTIDKAKRTIPGKAYIYEMMKKIMILGENVANHELFEEDEKHLFVEMGNSEALKECILACMEKHGGERIN